MKKAKNYRLMSEIEKEQPRKHHEDEDQFFDVQEQITRLGNRIYFYTEVTRDTVLQLIKQIRITTLELKNNSNNLNSSIKDSVIYLHINSHGGDMFAALAAVDYISKSEVPIYTIIDGCAASAAILMSVVGHKRFINENSYMLIHSLRGGFIGAYEEMIDEMKNNISFMERIAELYRKNTKIPKNKLKSLLSHDLWFDSKLCLQYGLVDHII